MPQQETATRIDTGETTAVVSEVAVFVEAVAILKSPAPVDLADLGQYLRHRAAGHLADRMNKYLHGDAPVFSTEAAALSVIKGAARDLRRAAVALYSAASTLRSAGLGLESNRTFHAARAAEASGDGLDPQ